jgi:hypothetical protein
VEYAFPVVLCCIGYASKGERVVDELEGTIGKLYSFENVEVGSFVSIVVSLERAECKVLWRSCDCDGRAEEDDVFFFL